MEVFQGTTDFYTDGPAAVTLGKFDGVHLGHQKLIRRIRQMERDGMRSVVFALNARTGPMLLTMDEQKDAAERMGGFLPDPVPLCTCDFRYVAGTFRGADPGKAPPCRIHCRRAGFPVRLPA